MIRVLLCFSHVSRLSLGSDGSVTLAGAGQLRLEARSSYQEQERLDTEREGEHEEELEECEESGAEQLQTPGTPGQSEEQAAGESDSDCRLSSMLSLRLL